MRFTRVFLSVLACGTLAACSAQPSSTSTSTNTSIATQALGGKGTEFDLPLRNKADGVGLIDQDGKRTSLSALKGKYVVIAPFLTICQDVCPMVSANFGRLSAAVTKAGLDDKVSLVELTVDPETDTPKRLLAYQALFSAKPNWHFLTGTPGAVSQVLSALGIAFEKTRLTKAEIDAGNPDWLTGQKPDHDVSHQDVVIIIGPDGHEKWLEEGIANTEGRSIPNSLQNYLSQDGRTNLASPDPTGSWTVTDVLSELTRLGGYQF